MRTLRLVATRVTLFALFSGLLLVGTARAGGLPMINPASLMAAPTTQPAAEPGRSTVLDAFGRTRLFQLAEGKQQTSLHEMLRPAFWIDTIKELVVAAVSFVPRVGVSLLFLFVFWLIYRALRRVVLGAMAKAHLDPTIRDLLVSVLKWTVMGFGGVIACNQVGIPIVAMLTGVSILGLAVGFAAQETLANFIAGIVIFWDKPFKVGDWLTVDGGFGGTFGQVQRITFRSCRLLAPGGEVDIYPNTLVLARRVANHSAHPLSRISVSVPLGDRPLHAVRSRMLATTRGDRRVVADPPPEVVVAECTKDATTLALRFWVADPAVEQRVAFEYRERAMLAVEAIELGVADVALPRAA